jgi:hypothetical protein
LFAFALCTGIVCAGLVLKVHMQCSGLVSARCWRTCLFMLRVRLIYLLCRGVFFCAMHRRIVFAAALVQLCCCIMCAEFTACVRLHFALSLCAQGCFLISAAHMQCSGLFSLAAMLAHLAAYATRVRLLYLLCHVFLCVCYAPPYCVCCRACAVGLLHYARPVVCLRLHWHYARGFVFSIGALACLCDARTFALFIVPWFVFVCYAPPHCVCCRARAVVLLHYVCAVAG